MKTTKPIILIDGSSYLYRAFFACPPLTNSRGEPTGATFGVINMIKSLLNQYNPSCIGVVFDAKGGSFRNTIYPSYKATRDEMPKDLISQIEPIHTIINAMGLPLLCVDGVEADDVIGTLAAQAVNKNKHVLISTGDKDLAQLVNTHVTLINTMNNQVLTHDNVSEKFGIPAKYIVDYLALMGDKSDNIPGVPGVGEKTASFLLNHFHGINELYQHLNEVPNLPLRAAKSIAEKLAEHKKEAYLSYQLATIHTNLTLPLTLDDLEIQKPDIEKLDNLFRYNGFNRWAIELSKRKFIPIAHNEAEIFTLKDVITVERAIKKYKKDYEIILSVTDFEKWIDKLKKSNGFTFDLTTTHLNHFEAELVGLSFCTEKGKAIYIPVSHAYFDVPKQLPVNWVIERLKPLFTHKGIAKITHNLKYNSGVLKTYDIVLQGPLFDTMLEAYLLNSNGHHDLNSIAIKYLDQDRITEKHSNRKSITHLPVSRVDIKMASQYAAEDADIIFQLHQTLWSRIEPDKNLVHVYKTVDIPLAIVLSKMERTGVLIDSNLLEQYAIELNEKLGEIEKKMFNIAGEPFNPNSPKQLQYILFEKQRIIPVKKTPKGVPSTSEEVLITLAEEHPLAQLILEHRSLAKLKNTYADKLPLMVNPFDHHVHTNYNQTGTVTGRLSSSDPNLQNIPVRNEDGRRIRQAFIAPEGYKMVSVDYSQIELRIMATISGDNRLRHAFDDNKDIHRFTAAETLGINEKEVTREQRRNAKAVNFGLIYGMSAYGLAKQLDISRHEAQTYINLYFKRYPGISSYMEKTRLKAAENGFVETLTKRRLYLPNIKSNRGIERRAAERAAINAPLQGTAADIIKIAMIEIQDWIETEAIGIIRMIMQVHDELVFEVKEGHIEHCKAKIKEIMEHSFKLNVPLNVSTGEGSNWDEAH